MADLAYSTADLKEHQVWRHVKTGGLYFVLGLAGCSTNGAEDAPDEVVYFSMDYQHWRRRDFREFLDGRFEPVKPKEPPHV